MRQLQAASFIRIALTMWTLPNLLSLFRMGATPVLLALAWMGAGQPFFWLLLASLATDALDGVLARAMNQPSDLGARLDSWADLITWLCLPLCGWWLRPQALASELPWLGAGLAGYLLSVAVGWIKFRRLIAYHTWLAKALSLLASVAVLVFFAGGPGWVLRALMPLVILSALEEILITWLLSEPLSNVPTAWHAWKYGARSVGALRSDPVVRLSGADSDVS